jgi:hypothetical protein
VFSPCRKSQTYNRILWHIDPLLGKDLKINKCGHCYTIDKQMAISAQWLNKHVPTEMRCTQQYRYNEKRGVFYVVSAKELKRRQLGKFGVRREKEGVTCVEVESNTSIVTL